MTTSNQKSAGCHAAEDEKIATITKGGRTHALITPDAEPSRPSICNSTFTGSERLTRNKLCPFARAKRCADADNSQMKLR
jgi:hypothetical protein